MWPQKSLTDREHSETKTATNTCKLTVCDPAHTRLPGCVTGGNVATVQGSITLNLI